MKRRPHEDQRRKWVDKEVIREINDKGVFMAKNKMKTLYIVEHSHQLLQLIFKLHTHTHILYIHIYIYIYIYICICPNYTDYYIFEGGGLKP